MSPSGREVLDLGEHLFGANAAALFYRRTVSDRAALEAEVAQFSPFAAPARRPG